MPYSELLDNFFVINNTFFNFLFNSFQFWDTSSELLSWIKSAMEKLDADLTLNIEDSDSAEAEIRGYEVMP